ncbi:hypothetical protein EV03_0060 [Prochlorococcus marinus str. PAC1]|uniref:Uncharacterized protein n=1 Tax=Prochlorococcus marinus str. PAC1 TaxID=59924 RepID=A0A0A2C7P4_PROMR|nr:hypothetical protein EV03_0060 [Prochlorococcus marinus str. PAC1]
MLKTIIIWYETLVKKAQKKLMLLNYQLYWAIFLEGDLVL